jgi:hypothetical protein
MPTVPPSSVNTRVDRRVQEEVRARAHFEVAARPRIAAALQDHRTVNLDIALEGPDTIGIGVGVVDADGPARTVEQVAAVAADREAGPEEPQRACRACVELTPVAARRL